MGKDHPETCTIATANEQHGAGGAMTLEKDNISSTRTAIDQKGLTKAGRAKEKKAVTNKKLKKMKKVMRIAKLSARYRQTKMVMTKEKVKNSMSIDAIM